MPVYATVKVPMFKEMVNLVLFMTSMAAYLKREKLISGKLLDDLVPC